MASLFQDRSVFTLGKWCLETASVILVKCSWDFGNVEECLCLEIASHPVWFLCQGTVFNWFALSSTVSRHSQIRGRVYRTFPHRHFSYFVTCELIPSQFPDENCSLAEYRSGMLNSLCTKPLYSNKQRLFHQRSYFLGPNSIHFPVVRCLWLVYFPRATKIMWYHSAVLWESHLVPQ